MSYDNWSPEYAAALEAALTSPDSYTVEERVLRNGATGWAVVVDGGSDVVGQLFSSQELAQLAANDWSKGVS